jgi:hypothetical protein
LVKMKFVLIQGEEKLGEKVIQRVRLNLWENNASNSVGSIEQLDFEPPF